MTSFDDLMQMVRRNQMLGRWAAEKLGLIGQEADAYARNLAMGTLEPDKRDVLSKIRKDFNTAGVVQSDQQILHVMNELMLQAGSMRVTRGGDGLDAAAVMLARNLTK
jgi:hypothetical protein